MYLCQYEQNLSDLITAGNNTHLSDVLKFKRRLVYRIFKLKCIINVIKQFKGVFTLCKKLRKTIFTT